MRILKTRKRDIRIHTTERIGGKMSEQQVCHRPQGACKRCRRFTVSGPKCPLYGSKADQVILEYIPGKGDPHDPFYVEFPYQDKKWDPKDPNPEFWPDDTFEI